MSTNSAAAFDRAVMPRAFTFFGVFVCVAILGRWLKPILLHSSNTVVRYSSVVVAGIEGFAVAFAFICLAIGVAAAGSLVSQRFIERGVSATTIKAVVAVSLLVFVAALFIYLPFCLGSLRDGTYDCIPLGTRMMNALHK